MDSIMTPSYQAIVRSICSFSWRNLSSEEMTDVAWAYYYFSIQFRESLKAARGVFPEDGRLVQLEREECATANLSPWPGVVVAGEEVNHDEFMRRTLELDPIPSYKAAEFCEIGNAYLDKTRRLSDGARAAAIASYEDGGLSEVFSAILTFPAWEGTLLQAFEHFLSEHVRFDSDPDAGHGALSRHIAITDEVVPFWEAFRVLLITCVPGLLRETSNQLGSFHGIDVQSENFPISAHVLDSSTSVLDAAR